MSGIIINTSGVLTVNGQVTSSGTLSSGQMPTLGGQANTTTLPLNQPLDGQLSFLANSSENQAPTPQQDSASVYEFGTIENIDVLSNDSDPDGDNLTVISAMASNGFAYVTEFNTINYTASFAGIDTITYTVQDIFGNTAQSFVMVDVLGDTGGGGGGDGGGGFNNTPIANDDQATTDEFTPVSINVLENDIDSDNDELSIVDVFVASGEVDDLSVENGVITVTPNSTIGGQEIDVIYEIQDSFGNTDTATLTVTVTPTGGGNTAPVAKDDFAISTGSQAVTINVLTNDKDRDGDTLDIVALSSNQGEVLVNEDKTITFIPNQDFVGDAIIEYTIQDSSGLTSAAQVNVTVVQAARSSEVSAVGQFYLDLSSNALVNYLGGEFGFGEYVLERNDDYYSDEIDIRSVFGDGGINFFGTNYTSLYVNNNGNLTFNSGLEEFTPAEIGLTFDSPIIAAFWADVDTRGGMVTPSLGGNSRGTNQVFYDLDSENGVFTATWDDVGYYDSYTNKINSFQLQLIKHGDNGDFDILFRYETINWTTGDASEGEDGLGGVPARVGYTAGNGVGTYESPISGNQEQVLLLDEVEGNTGRVGVYVYQVKNGSTADDIVQGTENSEFIFGNAGNDQIYGANGQDTLMGAEGRDSLYGGEGDDILNGGVGEDYLQGDEGNDTYVFNLGDGQDLINTYINNDKFAAVITVGTDTLSFGTGINVRDIHLTYSEDRSSLIFSIDDTTDSVMFQNYFTYRFWETDLIAITFADGTYWSLIDISQRLQQPPVLTGTQATLVNGFEDASYTLYASDLLQGFTDINGDILSVVNLTATHGVLTDNQNGTYSFTAHANFNGTINLNYQVSDGRGGVIDANNSLVLDAVNDAPIVNPNIIFEPKQIDENQLFSFTFSESVFEDIDGDHLTYTAMQTNGDALPTWLNFDAVTRTFTGTPSFNDAANLNIKVLASDGDLVTEQVFVLTINNVNVAPTGTPSAALTDGIENTPYTVLVSDLLQGFSDVDGDALSVINLKTYQGVLVDNENGTYTFTPHVNFNGTVNLNYQVSDGHGGIIEATQTLLLQPNNEVIGTVGADVLQGNTHDNIFIVNHARDVVFEAADAGIDTVQSSISYILRDNIENLTLLGDGNLSGAGNNLDNLLKGNEGNNRLLAGLGNDTVYGGAGSDTLNGGLGADVMKGGLGNDTYTVENVADVVFELANEGFDSVNSFVSYSLSANVERLNLENAGGQIDGFGNDLDNTLNGNNFANYLFGGAGNDTLQGKGGADTLEGGLGDDLYYVDNAGDIVTELASEGMDKVSSSVSYTLTANVEQLFLTGIAALSATGNESNNIIYGNNGNNQLSGGAGNDSLNGGLGNDILNGGAGNDTLVGGLGNDTYLFGLGSGRDLINNMDALGNDKLLFDTGVNAEQIWLRQLGNDLEVSIIGTAHSVKVQGWYSADENKRIDSLQLAEGNTLLASEVQTLVDAMAAFTPPPLGQTSLSATQQASLGFAIAVAWEVTS